MFKAENVIGVYISCLKWVRKASNKEIPPTDDEVNRKIPFSSKKKSSNKTGSKARKGKWKLTEKSFVSTLVDLMELDYHIMIEVEELEEEFEKFKYLDVLRQNVVNK